MSHLANKLNTNKHRDCLSYPDVKNALDNILKDFVVVPINKATGNIAHVCKRFYASVITRELELKNNSSTDINNNTSGLSANDIIDKNIRDLKIKFDIDNIQQTVKKVLKKYVKKIICRRPTNFLALPIFHFCGN